MTNRIKVISIELTQPIETITQLEGYQKLQGLVRLAGVPLGYVFLPIKDGKCTAKAIINEAIAAYSSQIAGELIRQKLASDQPLPEDLPTWLESIAHVDASIQSQPPSVSVIIAPRSPLEAPLLDCLKALHLATPQPLEIIVTAESPHTFPTVRAAFPQVTWLTTLNLSRSGQRNLALRAAQGEIIAFVDDTCRVDTHWVKAIATAFDHHPEVGAIAGLVIPADIETAAAMQFEQRYSLDRGTRRLWHHLDPAKPVSWLGLGTMWHASGANMAFRKALFTTVGEFDPALDQVGTTWAGADFDLFCRVLLSGNTLLYEPSAIVQHQAPDSETALQARVQQDIIGLYCYLAAGCQKFPELRRQFATVGVWKLYHLLSSWLRPYGLPRQLLWGELTAIAQSWQAYSQAQQAANSVLANPSFNPSDKIVKSFPAKAQKVPLPKVMAVRTVELSRPLAAIRDVGEYAKVRVFVTCGGRPIGSVDIANAHRPIGTMRLQQEIAMGLTREILAAIHGENLEDTWISFQALLQEHWLPPVEAELPDTLPSSLSDDVSVSIIITTCDRPDDLRNCLAHLLAVETPRSIEIIVADNRPASGLTPRVLTDFPTVKLVQEARPGAAYGRNAAIAASTGDIVVTIDDDVTVPPDWLEKLIAPMARPEVMVVTGNVLPKELETPAQFLFEQLKGGLGQGYRTFEANGDWLASTTQGLPPIWDLGVSANAAFRAQIFCHPQIGLLDETLGPGTPTCGGEECYLIYRVLRAGFTVVYEPSAYAWHRHRREMNALYHQVYSHMKGGMAFMMRVWLQDGDRRAFRHLFFQMPGYLKQRLIDWALRRHEAPLPFVWNEIRGYLDVFRCYQQSCRRVRRQGLSAPYLPVEQRPAQFVNREPADIKVLESVPAITTPAIGG